MGDAMKETTLYEELIEIPDIEVTLKNNPARINIVGKGDIQQDTMRDIISKVILADAKISLKAFGVLDIRFEKEDNDTELIDS